MKASTRTEDRTSLASQILGLPRIVRIGLVMAYSVGLTLLLMPLIDNLYLTYFFASETVLVPALLAAGAGVVMYMIGWRLMIGYVGELPPERPVIWMYVFLGSLILLLVVTLVVIGSIIGIEQ